MVVHMYSFELSQLGLVLGKGGRDCMWGIYPGTPRMALATHPRLGYDFIFNNSNKDIYVIIVQYLPGQNQPASGIPMRAVSRFPPSWE
jgi:hypothetical protein